MGEAETAILQFKHLAIAFLGKIKDVDHLKPHVRNIHNSLSIREDTVGLDNMGLGILAKQKFDRLSEKRFCAAEILGLGKTADVPNPRRIGRQRPEDLDLLDRSRSGTGR